MREIKFRIWDGYRIIDHEELRISAEKIFIKSGISFQYENDILLPLNNEHLKIMQYTGLKDKNGIEIYEGDVIKVIRKHWDNCGKENLEKITEEIGEVVFYRNWEVSLKTKVEEGNLYQPFSWIFKDNEDYEIEIIGNKFKK